MTLIISLLCIICFSMKTSETQNKLFFYNHHLCFIFIILFAYSFLQSNLPTEMNFLLLLIIFILSINEILIDNINRWIDINRLMRVSIINTVFVWNDFCQLVLKFHAKKKKKVVSKTTSCIMILLSL